MNLVLLLIIVVVTILEACLIKALNKKRPVPEIALLLIVTIILWGMIVLATLAHFIN